MEQHAISNLLPQAHTIGLVPEVDSIAKINKSRLSYKFFEHWLGSHNNYLIIYLFSFTFSLKNIFSNTLKLEEKKRNFKEDILNEDKV